MELLGYLLFTADMSKSVKTDRTRMPACIIDFMLIVGCTWFHYIWHEWEEKYSIINISYDDSMSVCLCSSEMLSLFFSSSKQESRISLLFLSSKRSWL